MPTNTKNSQKKPNLNKYLIAIIALLAVISATLGYFVIDNFESEPIVITNDNSEATSSIEPIELEIPEQDSEESAELDGIPALNLSEEGIKFISQTKNGEEVGSSYITKVEFSANRQQSQSKYCIVTNQDFPNFEPLLVIGESATLNNWESQTVATTNIFNSFPPRSIIYTTDPDTGKNFIVSMVNKTDETNPQKVIAFYDMQEQKELQSTDLIPQDHIVVSDLTYDKDKNILSYYYIPKTAVSNLSIQEGVTNEYNYTIEADFILKRELRIGFSFAVDIKIDIKKPDIKYKSISVFDDIIRFNTDSQETDTQYNLILNDDFTSSQEYYENFTHNSPYQAKVIDENSSKYMITKNGEDITDLDLRDNLGIFAEVYAKDGFIIVPTTIKGGFPPTVNMILIEEANPENIQVVFDTSKNGEFSPVILNRF